MVSLPFISYFLCTISYKDGLQVTVSTLQVRHSTVACTAPNVMVETLVPVS